MFIQVAFFLVLIAVSMAQPWHTRHQLVGGEDNLRSEASNTAQDGQYGVSVLANASHGLYSKRSIYKTLAFFVQRLNIMPQAFQGKGVHFYIFTK